MKVIVKALAVIVCAMQFSPSLALAAQKVTSSPASPERWKVFCNKKARNVVLGIHQPGVDHVQLLGPFCGTLAVLLQKH